MKKHSAGFLLLILFIIAGLLFPGIGAAVAGQFGQPESTGTTPDFNVTGVAVANLSIPAHYREDPGTVRIEVTVSESTLPGSKGEMQAGPRSIGISFPSAVFMIAALALIAIVAGSWYILKHGPDEEESEENGK